MIFEKIDDILKNEPSYRKNQINKAVFKDLIEDWSSATSLPLVLRNMLLKEAPLKIEGSLISSNDSETVKALIKLCDGILIETVLLRHKKGRNTVCLSSQAGCAMGCSYCKTGEIGLKRNLSTSEIISQLLFFLRILKKENQKVSNIVFMGMGEPFLNYDNLIKSLKIITDKDMINIGQRKISVSTVGIPEKIRKFADENMQVNLAVSINGCDDDSRSKIMPVSKKYSFDDIIDAVKYYISRTNRRVMFEYVMIRNVNDDLKSAQKLAKKIEGLLCFVNIIAYNGIEKEMVPQKEKIAAFKNIIEKNNISCTQRYRFGSDIQAACGQLVYLASE